MTTLQDLDVRSRGVAMLVEDWEAKRAAVRQTWKVEDLLWAVPTLRPLAAPTFSVDGALAWSNLSKNRHGRGEVSRSRQLPEGPPFDLAIAAEQN